MSQERQTSEFEAGETLAFRTSAGVKHLVAAAASRREVLKSDWLRAVVERALVEEFGPSALSREALTPEEHAQARYASKELPTDGRES